jgi:hypothetical protein
MYYGVLHFVPMRESGPDTYCRLPIFATCQGMIKTLGRSSTRSCWQHIVGARVRSFAAGARLDNGGPAMFLISFGGARCGIVPLAPAVPDSAYSLL